MNWKKFFGFTKIKLLCLIILTILINIIPTSHTCVDGVGFGYCIDDYGYPFHSFIVTGEVGGIPASHWAQIIITGIIGFVANLLIAYLVLSLIFFIYYKFKKSSKKK